MPISLFKGKTIMLGTIERGAYVLRHRLSGSNGDYIHRVRARKLKLIDQAFQKYQIKTLLDAGGCWGVHGGYTLYALSKYKLDKAIIIDDNPTKTSKIRGAKYPQLDFIQGDFGSAEIIGSVGKVDAVILFDVLVHQANPDWNVILERYSKITNAFIVYHQTYTDDMLTRLWDLGPEGFVKNTPMSEQKFNEIKDKLDQIHPRFQKPYRDIHYYWQWGIPEQSLCSTLADLGFSLDLSAECGHYTGLPKFKNKAFLFSRTA